MKIIKVATSLIKVATDFADGATTNNNAPKSSICPVKILSQVAAKIIGGAKRGGE